MSWISEQAVQAKSDHDKKKKNPSEAGKIISGGVNDVIQQVCRHHGRTPQVKIVEALFRRRPNVLHPLRLIQSRSATFVLPCGGNLFSALFEVKVNPLGSVLSCSTVHVLYKRRGRKTGGLIWIVAESREFRVVVFFLLDPG